MDTIDIPEENRKPEKSVDRLLRRMGASGKLRGFPYAVHMIERV